MSIDADDPDKALEEGVVPFPSLTGAVVTETDDIVWFDPESLAQRSEIGKGARRPGWWCPQDLAPNEQRTPCWGAVQPTLDPNKGKATPLWNDPDLPFVQRWSRALGLAVACPQRGAAYALLDQMLESLVVSNLFEREPEPHRALLVTERSAHAWWRDLLGRWAHTSTPEGHCINASHPDFASHWLLVSYDVWDQDQAQLQDWLLQARHQKAIGFHLPGFERSWAHLVNQGRQWAIESGVKYLVAGQSQDLDVLAWDPRDRIALVPKAQAEGFDMTWDNGVIATSIHYAPEPGVFFF